MKIERPSLSLDIIQGMFVVGYRHFGKTNPFHLQKSSNVTIDNIRRKA